MRILLTGGTGGLGMGVTPVLLDRGADLTIPYISDREVDRLKGILSPQDFARIQFVALDLLNESAVAQLVDDLGRIDALIHLVGGFSMGNTHEYSYNAWKQDFDLNLNTTFLVCKHCLRKMREQGYGRIVTVGSRAAIEPGGQIAAYSASKAAVIALTQSIAAETKGTNITANIVLPSIIDTPTNREAMGDTGAESWVKPESIGQVIAFLASEEAKDIRGATIPVYGNT
jgi:NAD(P)-dependent dehydrogenase (short-subunit alcohol dehydrogenase family)